MSSFGDSGRSALYELEGPMWGEEDQDVHKLLQQSGGDYEGDTFNDIASLSGSIHEDDSDTAINSSSDSANDDNTWDDIDISNYPTGRYSCTFTPHELPPSSTTSGDSAPSSDEDWEYATRGHGATAPRRREPHRSNKKRNRKIQSTLRVQQVTNEQSQIHINTTADRLEAKRKETTVPTQHLAPWGDELTLNDQWPSVQGRNTLRIFHINMNGIMANNDYLEWEVTLHHMLEMQVDIFGITEPNLDFHQGAVRAALNDKMSHCDKFGRLSVSSSKHSVDRKTPFQRGGTITGSFGTFSGRLHSNRTTDPLGRWSELSFTGKKGITVHIITTYRPCRPSHSQGGTTVYMQQQHDYIKLRRRNADPRAQLLRDLQEYIIRIPG